MSDTYYSFPPGFDFNPETSEIFRNSDPTVPGTYIFRVCAQQSATCTSCVPTITRACKDITITVGAET